MSIADDGPALPPHARVADVPADATADLEAVVQLERLLHQGGPVDGWALRRGGTRRYATLIRDGLLRIAAYCDQGRTLGVVLYTGYPRFLRRLRILDPGLARGTEPSWRDGSDPSGFVLGLGVHPAHRGESDPPIADALMRHARRYFAAAGFDPPRTAGRDGARVPACWSEIGHEAAGERPPWRRFWDAMQPIPKSIAREAEEYVRRLTETIPLDSRMRVLDFGCGFGTAAALLAPRVGTLGVWDSSPTMRRHARARLAMCANVEFVDPRRGLADGQRFDLVLVNSVFQYLHEGEIGDTLRLLHDLLRPAGRIVVSDSIPQNYSPLADVVALLRFNPMTGFQRIGSGLTWYLRPSARFFRLSREDLEREARNVGLTSEPLARNLTHFAGRFAAVLRERTAAKLASTA